MTVPIVRIRGLNISCSETCLVSQALDGMCVGLAVVSQAGRVLWMNRCATRTLGVERSEVEGKSFTQILKDPQLADFWHRAQKDEVHMDEVHIHWPRRADLKASVTHCADREGNSLGRALLFCDVTAERQVQMELSHEATERLLELTNGRSAQGKPNAGLTPQEIRVLRLVGEGARNDEIAKAMHVALSTVRSHLKHVYRKLQLGSRSEAIHYAIENGLA
jgi:PAS domain S-box-containing protein